LLLFIYYLRFTIYSCNYYKNRSDPIRATLPCFEYLLSQAGPPKGGTQNVTPLEACRSSYKNCKVLRKHLIEKNVSVAPCGTTLHVMTKELYKKGA